MKLYFASLGGKHRVFYWIALLSILCLSEFTDNMTVWFLGYWARQYEERPAEEVKAQL